MLAIFSKYNDDNVKYHITGFKKNLNIQSHLLNDLNFNKNEILNKSRVPIKFFKNYVSTFIKADGKKLGVKKLIKIISKI